MIYSAANEEYLKMNEVTETLASEFLMYLNFKVRKSELERLRIERASR